MVLAEKMYYINIAVFKKIMIAVFCTGLMIFMASVVVSLTSAAIALLSKAKLKAKSCRVHLIFIDKIDHLYIFSQK